MKIERVLVLMPKNNSWYQAVAAQIVRAFSLAGFQAAFFCGALSEAALNILLEQFKPQVIFDMNASRADRPGLSRQILHVCWVVDFNGRTLESFVGSDITYLFAAEWMRHYPNDGFFGWLPPGVCTESYFPQQAAYAHAASFVGHIPKPWSETELRRNIAAEGKVLRFGEVLPFLQGMLKRNKAACVVQDDYKLLLSDYAEKTFNTSICFDHQLQYDLSGRLIRLLNRRALMEKLVTIDGLALYGPENWSHWPEYQPFYQRFLDSVDDMRTVYNCSYANFHEGCSMHFRVVDAMACGGLLFIKKHGYDEGDSGIKRFFNPGVHFVEFDEDDLLEKHKFYSDNPGLADKLREAALQTVKAGHTWTHRVEQISRDLAGL